MNVRIYHYPALTHQLRWGSSFSFGLAKHGVSSCVIPYGNEQDCDLAVFWGHGPKNELIRKQQIKAGRHYLVMEAGFFNDRFLHCSLGFDGLNGQADFLNHSSPSDRWLASRSTLKEWNPGGDYYLLIGQIAGDNSCSHIDLGKWYAEVISKTQAPVMFRPHPLDRSGWTPKSGRMSSTSLERDMAGAIAVITFSSTAGVDAMIAGKPTVAYDPISMVYNVVPHRIQLTSLVEPDRAQWAYNLAYTQWSKDEIESGLAWDHLRGMYAN